MFLREGTSSAARGRALLGERERVEKRALGGGVSALGTHVEAEAAGHETRAWQGRAPDMLRFLFPPE
ncbi:MAG: hypothetical protein AAF845_01380 [Bacteroidota bacterium]